MFRFTNRSVIKNFKKKKKKEKQKRKFTAIDFVMYSVDKNGVSNEKREKQGLGLHSLSRLDKGYRMFDKE